MKKLIIKYLFLGIAWGSIAVIANLLVFYQLNPTNYNQLINVFPIFSLGLITVSMGFISTSIVYEIKQLRFHLKLLIHLVVSIGVLILVVFIIEDFQVIDFSGVMINIGLNGSIVFAVWSWNYLKDKKELEQINARLKERKLQRYVDTE